VTSTLRSATAEDFAALARVQRRAVDVCLRPLYDGATVDTWIEGLDATKFLRVAAMGEEIVVAVVDGSIVGFVSFHAEMALLGMWYVDPSCMGRGVGSSLLQHAEARLVEFGCTEAMTEASLFARPHFEARGWAAVEEYDKPAFGGVFRVTRMSKALVD
jgi:putative acetyltransferase